MMNSTFEDRLQRYKEYVDTNILMCGEISLVVTVVGEELVTTGIKDGNIKRILIPEFITVIGNASFARSMELEKVIMSKSVHRIEAIAFMDCVKLKEINIPESVTEIGDYAFYCNVLLEEIYIPESVESIGLSAFGLCDKLKMMSIPSRFKGKESYMGINPSCEITYI